MLQIRRAKEMKVISLGTRKIFKNRINGSPDYTLALLNSETLHLENDESTVVGTRRNNCLSFLSCLSKCARFQVAKSRFALLKD